MVEPRPDAGLVPVAEPAPARHPGAAVHLVGEHLPRDAGAEYEEDAGERGPVRNAWTPTARLGRLGRNERFDDVPEVVGQQRLHEALRRRFRPEVLLGGLRGRP